MITNKFLYIFIFAQIAFQSALILPGIGSLRIVLRVGAFAASLAMLLLPRYGRQSYPLSLLVGMFLSIVTIEFIHPNLNTVSSGIATIAFYTAIWCPVFWVAKMKIVPQTITNLILILWVFHTISSAVGVLQVYAPDRFAPDPEFVKNNSGFLAEGLKIELANGQKIYRPFGLTDSPGGAAASGAFVVLIGLLLVGSNGFVMKLFGASSVLIGMFCIYLSHIRSALIVTAFSVIGLIAMIAARGQIIRAIYLAAILAGSVILAFTWASMVGGMGVTNRFSTLIEEDPGKVYQSNRGGFLEDTINTYLWEYPLGAGLGRYGMMNLYFGTTTNPDSPTLWVEIQSTAWVYDGGASLLVAGYSAIIGACIISIRIAITTHDVTLAANAAAIAGYDFSILINTLSYCNFLSQGGLMFWVLNAALYTASKATPVKS